MISVLASRAALVLALTFLVFGPAHADSDRPNLRTISVSGVGSVAAAPDLAPAAAWGRRLPGKVDMAADAVTQQWQVLKQMGSKCGVFTELLGFEIFQIGHEPSAYGTGQ